MNAGSRQVSGRVAGTVARGGRGWRGAALRRFCPVRATVCVNRRKPRQGFDNGGGFGGWARSEGGFSGSAPDRGSGSGSDPDRGSDSGSDLRRRPRLRSGDAGRVQQGPGRHDGQPVQPPPPWTTARRRSRRRPWSAAGPTVPGPSRRRVRPRRGRTLSWRPCSGAPSGSPDGPRTSARWRSPRRGSPGSRGSRPTPRGCGTPGGCARAARGRRRPAGSVAVA